MQACHLPAPIYLKYPYTQQLSYTSPSTITVTSSLQLPCSQMPFQLKFCIPILSIVDLTFFKFLSIIYLTKHYKNLRASPYILLNHPLDH
jgi:hypothetical protein